LFLSDFSFTTGNQTQYLVCIVFECLWKVHFERKLDQVVSDVYGAQRNQVIILI